jgi:omega-6 fatty acid desaturase (delta-12 desaturase)
MKTHRELKAFANEDRRLTWRLLIGTLVAAGACAAIVLSARAWWLMLAASIVLGLVRIRLGMFFHDYMHKAIFKGSRLGGLVMKAVGLSMLTSPKLWLEWHQEHHWHTGRPDATAVFGGFPMMTLESWRNASARERLRYRVGRHPIVIVFAYLTMFVFMMNIQPIAREPRRRPWLWAVLALHVASLGGLAAFFGWATAICLVVVPLVVTHAVLAWMFFAQHNFPEIDLRDDDTWSHDYAALRASSFFEMSPLMHWLTGNLGFHHIHHLNHRVPFYRLPDAMAAIPALQDPMKTSWQPSDMLASARLAVWDAANARMVTYAELDQRVARSSSSVRPETTLFG